MEHYKNFSLQNIEGEEWRDIIGYEGYYRVSSMGRIKSLARTISHSHSGSQTFRERIKMQQLTEDGYLKVRVSKRSKMISLSVHRTVGIAFVANPENKPQINHKKGIKIDNRATELEWTTNLENMRHSWMVLGRKAANLGNVGFKNKISIPIYQLDLNGRIIKEWASASQIRQHLGHSCSNIIDSCLKGRCAKGFRWIYKRELSLV